ncbi:MAG: tRNA (adenosine(37)-N6)-threonylcarbamoyltransferase complex transferase subunit TsaD [Planctomycetota bacterium]|jgi:N6-L-threonylcarbamoyladenine synthase
MRILGIESSCDETAAAIVEDGARPLSSIVATQHELHGRFGGVVPEIACRAHIEAILPVVREALDEAGTRLQDIDAVAVTTTPGLIGSLLIGVTAAKALCWASELPLLAVDHLHAHIYCAWLSGQKPELPAASLVVSGGHTSLFVTEGPLSHTRLGGTVDDAAGEAFDKVANILRLGYPGGPAIELAAVHGSRTAVDFPRSWLDPEGADFSFSGLKTAVLYHCLGQNASKEDIDSASHDAQFVADVAASFQEAVVDVLVGKTCAAAERHYAHSIIVGGGVAANCRLRERIQTEAAARGLVVYLAPRGLCTDNAAMTAGIGYHLLEQDLAAPLNVEATP